MTGFMVIKLLYSFLPVVESITNECRTEILAKGEKLVLRNISTINTKHLLLGQAQSQPRELLKPIHNKVSIIVR